MAPASPGSTSCSSRSVCSTPRRRATRSPPPRRGASRSWARGVLGGGLLAAAVGDSTPIHHHPKRPLILRLQEVTDAPRHRARSTGDRLRPAPTLSTMVVGITTTSHLHRYLDLVAAGPLDPTIRADVERCWSARGAADG